MFVCILDELMLSFCYSDLTLETGGFELALTTTLVLQANRLTKCASHPKAGDWSELGIRKLAQMSLRKCY